MALASARVWVPSSCDTWPERTISKPIAAPTTARALAIGLSPSTTTSGGGRCGSRKISNVPPLRHGLWAVTLPGTGSSAVGLIRSTIDSPESSKVRDWARTVDSAQSPPTNPSIVPSARTIASSPGWALVGRSARTTRA